MAISTSYTENVISDMPSPLANFIYHSDEKWNLHLQRTTWAEVELAWNLAVYALTIWTHSRKSMPYYPKVFKRLPPLWVHFMVAVLDVFRYHVRALKGPVYPDVFDLGMCLLHSAGSLDLAWDLPRGTKLARLSHQSMAVDRVVFSTLGYLLQNPALHRASVKVNSAFVYARWMNAPIKMTKMFKGHRPYYDAQILMCAVFAMAETGLWGWVYMLFATIWGLSMVESWCAAAIRQRGLEKSGPLVRGLASLGFADVEVLSNRAGDPVDWREELKENPEENPEEDEAGSRQEEPTKEE